MDATGPLILAGLSAAASVGLWVASSRHAATTQRMRDALQQGPTAPTGTYIGLCGLPVAAGAWLQAEHSGEQTVVTRTRLLSRWSERTVRRVGRAGREDTLVYGPWQQQEEQIGEPVVRSVPFAVTTTVAGPQGSVATAVAVEWDSTEQLPLVLRHSKLLEEATAAGGGGGGARVNINNSNNSGAVMDGSTERRELGTLREEYLLPCGGQPLTVWGIAARDQFGGLVVSCRGTKGATPWVCALASPSVVLEQRDKRARLMFWGAVACGALGAVVIAVAVTKQPK